MGLAIDPRLTKFGGMSNTFGEYLRITTWGESHGPGIGVVIDGLPAGLPVTPELLPRQRKRRRPGGALSSPRREPDEPQILSGVFEGRTLGTPLSIYIESSDVRSQDYDSLGATLDSNQNHHDARKLRGPRPGPGPDYWAPLPRTKHGSDSDMSSSLAKTNTHDTHFS